MKRKTILATGAATVLLAGAAAYWAWSTRHAPAGPETPAPPTREETEEERSRRLLLGTWRDHYQGQRTMTLHEDGTGTMLVELSGLQAILFAPKLRFDMRWSWDGKTLTKRTVGGDPADKVNLILKTMGDTAEDTALELTADRLLLLDKNGKTRYDWKRLQDGEPKSQGPRD